MRIKLYIFITIAFLTGNVFLASAQEDVFTKFPAKSDPETIGKILAQNYISEPFRNFDGITTAPSEVTYPEVCTWFGALKFADVTDNKKLLKKLENRFLPLLGSNKELMQKPDHVDHTVFGVVPLQLYLQTQIEPYYYIGIDFADRQWQLPSKATKNKEKYKEYLDKGLSWQTRFWIDDMFMISAIQSQAFLASGDISYIERAANEMNVYLDAIQQPNGLFYHADTSPFYWCRGNGWMAAGMAELLKYLPEDNPNFPRILKAYKKMMDTLKGLRNQEGLWNQLVDDKNAWTETSGSAMFTYAMITGVKRQWLSAAEYEPVVKKAWNQLVSYMDKNGNIQNVSQGTNTGDTKEYYLNRKQITGDLHGQAPMLWCAAALLEEKSI